jgi:AraC family transcriptional regulator
MLRDYIMDNMHRTVGLSELASLANLSRFHLLRAFKKSLGVTPYKYITEQRVERAKELLSRTDMPIAAISDLCGFGAFAHFSATFRRMTGSTPTQFRLVARGPAR